MKLNHHAYVIEGFSDEYSKNLSRFFSELLNIDENDGRTENSSPNFLHIKNNQLDIDDARRIVDFNSKKSFGDVHGNKVIFIEINSAGHQAQNALLKTLEEPSSKTYFFIIVPSASILLPTIKSRVQIYGINEFFDGNKLNESDVSLAKLFLQSDVPKRLEMIKEMMDNDNPSALVRFLNDLEITIHKLVKEKAKKRLNSNELSALVLAREYFADPGASKKMLLEYLAMELPIV